MNSLYNSQFGQLTTEKKLLDIYCMFFLVSGYFLEIEDGYKKNAAKYCKIT